MVVSRDFDFRSLGRNHSDDSQLRNVPTAVSRAMVNGRSPSGRTTFESPGASTTAAAPQKAHADAATCGSSVVCAPHRLQTTTLRSAPHPRSRGERSAAPSGFSATPGLAAIVFSAPQYGHFSAETPGSQRMSAPHDSQGNRRTFAAAAVAIVMASAHRAGGGGGGGGGGSAAANSG